jgi:23S rRNA pseudouridine2605 synthase
VKSRDRSGGRTPRPRRADPSAAKTRFTLDRALSRLGICSRAQATEAIRAGHVRVNGRVVRDPAAWVDVEHDRIVARGAAAPARCEPRHFAFHKPLGVVTTHRDERGRACVADYFPADAGHLVAAGRLDRDTSGLLVLTSDNDLANFLTAPDAKVAKSYIARLRGRAAPVALDRLRFGVELDDGRTRPCEVALLRHTTRDTWIEITLHEGRNRQIRRMAAAVGHPVLRLVRVRIGALELSTLAPGALRELSADEVARLLGYRARPAGARTPRVRGES